MRVKETVTNTSFEFLDCTGDAVEMIRSEFRGHLLSARWLYAVTANTDDDVDEDADDIAALSEAITESDELLSYEEFRRCKLGLE